MKNIANILGTKLIQIQIIALHSTPLYMYISECSIKWNVVFDYKKNKHVKQWLRKVLEEEKE